MEDIKNHKMRDTKFRGKRSNDGIWIFGDLIKIKNSYHILDEGDLVEDGHHIRQDSDRPTWIEPETLGEFTGLYDSHGTKIYEGDIVKTDYHVEKVVYEKKRVSGDYIFLITATVFFLII